MTYDINIVVKVLLECIGVVAIVAGGVKAITYFLSPFRKMSKRIDEHEQWLKEDKKAIEQQTKAIADLTDLTKDILKIQISMLNHMIDGNGYEEMKKLRTELQEKL